MRITRKFTIVIVTIILYYFLDAFLDSLLFGDLTLSEITFTGLPPGILFNRLFGMFLIIIAFLFYFRTQSKKETAKSPQIQAEEDPLFTYLNSFALVEMVAVELKTTMNIVLGFVDMLKDTTVYQHTRSVFTEYVYSSSSNLMQLLNNLVELQHILNNKISRIDSTFNLNQLLTNLHKKSKAELENSNKSNLNLELHLPDENKELVIKTDSNKLTLIIESLIQNAIGFSDNGTINYGFTMDPQKEIRFFFHDNGAGFSMDQLEIDFKSHLIQSGGMDISYNLAALRMEVARRLAEVLGGKIWSKSKMGDGSSFYFSIPVDKRTRNIEKEEHLENANPDWSNRKILIAEDIDSNFMLLKTILSKSNVEIVRACNGSEAVNLFKNNTHKFNAVLMDILMPEMDGFEAASQIKKMNSTIPIIGQTAYCLDSEEEKENMQNFDDFLTKPIWSHELIRSLSKYL